MGTYERKFIQANAFLEGKFVFGTAIFATLICLIVGFSSVWIYPEVKRAIDPTFDYVPVRTHNPPPNTGLWDNYFYFPRVKKYMDGKFFVSDPLIKETRYKPVAHTTYAASYALASLGALFSSQTHHVFIFVYLVFPLVLAGIIYATLKKAAQPLVALGGVLLIVFYPDPIFRMNISRIGIFISSAVFMYGAIKIAQDNQTHCSNALMVICLALAPITGTPYALALACICGCILLLAEPKKRRTWIHLLLWSGIWGLAPFGYAVWQSLPLTDLWFFTGHTKSFNTRGFSGTYGYFYNLFFDNIFYMTAITLATLSGNRFVLAVMAGSLASITAACLVSQSLLGRIFSSGSAIPFHIAIIIGCCQTILGDNRIKRVFRKALNTLFHRACLWCSPEVTRFTRNLSILLFFFVALGYAGNKAIPIVLQTHAYYSKAATAADYDHAKLLRWVQCLNDSETILTLDGNLLQELSSYTSAWMYVPYVVQTALPHDRIVERTAKAFRLYGYTPEVIRQKLESPESSLADNTLFRYYSPGHAANLWLALFYGAWVKQKSLDDRPFTAWATELLVNAVARAKISPVIEATVVIICKQEYFAPLPKAPLWKSILPEPLFENAHYVVYRLVKK